MNAIIGLLLFFLICFFEHLYTKKKKMNVYDKKQSISHLTNGLGQLMINALTMQYLILFYLYLYNNYSFYKFDHSVLSIIFAILITDFCYYWAHRLGHRVNFFVAIHYVHHQAVDYNLLSAFRLPWFNRFVLFTFNLPLAFLGIDLQLLIAGAALNSLVATISHSATIKRNLGFLEDFFVTPKNHYVHHGTNKPYQDRNFGGVFIFWDKLFGTYQKLDENIKVQFPQNNIDYLDPFYANTAYFKKIFFAMQKENTILRKLRVLFDKPEKYDDILVEKKFAPRAKREDTNDQLNIVFIFCFQLFLLYLVDSKSLPVELSFLSLPIAIIYFYLFRRLSLLYIT